MTSRYPTEAFTCANTLAPSSSILLTNRTRSVLLLGINGDTAPPPPTGGHDRAHFLIIPGCLVRDRMLGGKTLGSFRVVSSSLFFFEEVFEEVVSVCAAVRLLEATEGYATPRTLIPDNTVRE